jgi:hypothetical protein
MRAVVDTAFLGGSPPGMASGLRRVHEASKSVPLFIGGPLRAVFGYPGVGALVEPMPEAVAGVSNNLVGEAHERRTAAAGAANLEPLS